MGAPPLIGLLKKNQLFFLLINSEFSICFIFSYLQIRNKNIKISKSLVNLFKFRYKFELLKKNQLFSLFNSEFVLYFRIIYLNSK